MQFTPSYLPVPAMMMDDTLQQPAFSIEPKENLFWTNMAKRLVWSQFPSMIDEGRIGINDRKDWYSDGVLNASFNCIDRHLDKRDEKVALIWQGDDPQKEVVPIFRTGR